MTRMPTDRSDPFVLAQDFVPIRPPLSSWTPFVAAAPPAPVADASEVVPRPWQIGAVATRHELDAARGSMGQALDTLEEADRQDAKRRRQDLKVQAGAAGLTYEARWRAEAASSSGASSSVVQAEGDKKNEKPWKKFPSRGERGGKHVKLAKELATGEFEGTMPLASHAAVRYREWSKRHHSGVWKQAEHEFDDDADVSP